MKSCTSGQLRKTGQVGYNFEEYLGIFHALPQELVSNVVRLLDASSLRNLGATNSFWDHITIENSLWISCYKHDFGIPKDVDVEGYGTQISWREIYTRKANLSGNHRSCADPPQVRLCEKVMVVLLWLFIGLPLVLFGFLDLVLPLTYRALSFYVALTKVNSTHKSKFTYKFVGAFLFALGQAILMLWVDSIVGMMVPIIGWYLLVLTVYRLPAYYRHLKDGAYGYMAGATVMIEIAYLATDLVVVLFVVPVIIICIHRLPHWLHALRQRDYDYLIGRNYWWTITTAEAKKSLDIRSAISHDGFWAGFALPAFTVLFAIFCYVVAVPTFLVLMVMVSHRSITLVIDFSRFFRNMPTSFQERFFTPLKIVFLQAFGLGFDVALIMLPIFGYYTVFISVYRMPVLVKRLRAVIGSDWSLNRAIRTSIEPMIQGFLVVLDACVVVFLVVPIILTIHRVPAYIRLLRNLGYYRALHRTTFASVTWGEFKRIFTSLPSLNAVFCIGLPALGICIAYMISAIALAILSLSMSYRVAYFMYKIYLKPRNPVALMFHGLSCLAVLLVDIFLAFGLPIFAWFLCWIFFWRVPAILYDAGKVSKKGEMPERDEFIQQLELSLLPLLHFGRALLDFLALIGFVVPIFLTVHRVPYLLKRLQRMGYIEGVIESKWRGIAFAEFKHILFCELSKQDTLINNIVRAPVEKDTSGSERKSLQQNGAGLRYV